MAYTHTIRVDETNIFYFVDEKAERRSFMMKKLNEKQGCVSRSNRRDTCT